MAFVNGTRGNHGLVFGASGILGWATVNAILQGYPSPEAFSQVTALTNRPLPPEVAQWPESSKLQVVSGIDLLSSKGQQGLEAEIQKKVKDIGSRHSCLFFLPIS